jgi:hypothetical protein
MHYSLLLLFTITCLSSNTAASPRTVSVQEVQPTETDRVRTVWLNGPTISSKLGRGWPAFGDGTSETSTKCTTHDDAYTGYNSNGNTYCQRSDGALDQNAHLIVHSGSVAVVLDAAGLSGGDTTQRNMFPKIGRVAAGGQRQTSQQIFDRLPGATTNFSLSTTCSGTTTNYVLGTSKPNFFQIGLVRQGHAVTQLTLSALQFENASSGEPYGASYGPCAGFQPLPNPHAIVRAGKPTNKNCNEDFGGLSWPCPESFPTCVGFKAGASWGKCWSVCTAPAPAAPNVWVELSVWGDSLSFRFAWNGLSAILPSGCTGEVKAIVTAGSTTGTKTAALGSATQHLSFLFVANASNDELTNSDLSVAGNTNFQPVQVTLPSGSSATVVARRETRDVVVEVATNTNKCGYNTVCKTVPLLKTDIVLTNEHPTEARSIRLSFSRNFNWRVAGLSQSGTSAEITGLVGQLFDTVGNVPSGIPCHISKNWHTGSTSAYWAGFEGYWWTVNCFLRLPANATIPLSLALNYEHYGGISAFSHGQLSIVGYSDKWLWEQAALGTGGENICFDPLGSHTRASITDVRPKLFDGKWKENIGGGDFVWLFGPAGKLQYPKALDPQLHSNGPCLSNASYSSVTLDDSLKVDVQVSGGRTDDLVRVFFHIKVKVTKDVPKFTRLVLFQFGSETYNYRATFDKFVVGSSGGEVQNHTQEEYARTCSGGTSRATAKMYADADSNTPFRKQMEGKEPWWFGYGSNSDTATMASSNGMVVGDRGLVVRQYRARLNGINSTSPSFSILCDKIELGTPRGLLALKKDDFVEMKLEVLVLPRVGAEYDAAIANTNSPTLLQLQPLSTSWEKVKRQAEGGHLHVTPLRPVRATVESHYPIRVCSTGARGDGVARTMGDTGVWFKVEGTGALGYVPIVICNLTTHDIPKLGIRGLWIDQNSNGQYTLLNQETSVGANDFYQVNYDRTTHTYEVVYNVELFDTTTTLGFGSDPRTWPNSTCVNFNQCHDGVNHLTTSPESISCSSGTCLMADCCVENPTCAGFACSTGVNHLKPSPSSIVCVTAPCQVSECCVENPTCAGFACSTGVNHLKPSPSSIVCVTAPCQVSECCDVDTRVPSPEPKVPSPEPTVPSPQPEPALTPSTATTTPSTATPVAPTPSSDPPTPAMTPTPTVTTTPSTTPTGAPTPGHDPIVCCAALTVSCEACRRKTTVAKYCTNHPSTVGCSHSQGTTNDGGSALGTDNQTDALLDSSSNINAGSGVSPDVVVLIVALVICVVGMFALGTRAVKSRAATASRREAHAIAMVNTTSRSAADGYTNDRNPLQNEHVRDV